MDTQTRPCQVAESTKAIGEQILAGRKVTADDVVDQRYAEDRLGGNRRMSCVLHYLRKHYPDIPIGYVPNHNGGLGTYQRLTTIDERIATTRRSFVRTRGHVKGSAQVVANAPIGLSEDDKAGWAVAVRPSYTELMAQFATVAEQMAQALKEALMTMKQLEAGSDRSG